MLVAVSGNLGSGKSTLARYIARKYNFRYVPHKRFEFDFIEEFFSDIEGKFFPAQVSFLLSKATEIQAIGTRQNIVMDRSLMEDINVFAKLWIDNRHIDEKITQLYHYTAEFISSAIPAPDLYLVCRCPPEVCAQRIKNRPVRSFETQYPTNHINVLSEYYSSLSFGWGVPYVEIDTTYYDFTDETVLDSVCESIFKRLEPNNHYKQLSLFDDIPEKHYDVPIEIKGLTFHNFDGVDQFMSVSHPSKSSKYIYLAAPFTQLAKSPEHTAANSLIENSTFFEVEDVAYGELPRSYRQRLLRIESALKKQCGMRVLLPHRDINKWGRVSYPSQYITPRIVDTVKNAAAVVAIPGTSIGVHMEIGIAISRDIPVIVIETADFQSSFFVEGLRNVPCVRCIKASSLAQIPVCIEQHNISEFIYSYGGEK